MYVCIQLAGILLRILKCRFIGDKRQYFFSFLLSFYLVLVLEFSSFHLASLKDFGRACIVSFSFLPSFLFCLISKQLALEILWKSYRIVLYIHLVLKFVFSWKPFYYCFNFFIFVGVFWSLIFSWFNFRDWNESRNLFNSFRVYNFIEYRLL